ncbi:hypothetical protein SAMN05444920_12627 [Nonomuraea solani]|uniref:Endonuclease/Exonuclease/phosphatase family protein n=2 Tax=Nonomuraea solani TaxID=1144553 RepID=A0A1H6EZS2_9ACTN|nr:hypothetical protein SAMN05444920_12627 [Nonomuraea solani]
MLLCAVGATPAGASRLQAPHGVSWQQAMAHNLRQLSAGVPFERANLWVSAEPGPTTWTHNISGNRTHGGHAKALNPLKSAITAQSNLPLSIGMQEACLGQVLLMTAWLREEKNPHYQVSFHNQNPGGCDGQGYGVAVFAIGKLSEVHGAFANANQYPFDEQRGFACIRSVYKYQACSAHITPHEQLDGEGGVYQKRQFQEMRNVVAWIHAATGDSVYWGGDFYLTPSGITNNFGADFFANNSEGDICFGRHRATHRRVNGLERKVDYVFRTKPVECGRDATIRWNLGSSDHALLGGYI